MKRNVAEHELPGNAIESERGMEKEPKINLKFFFASHVNPKDWEGLKELISQCDVYAIEGVGWDEEHLQEYNKVASGKSRSNYSTRPDRLGMKELEALYNSHKLVAYIDIPAGHPLDLADRELHKNEDLAFKHFSSGEFEKAVAEIKKYVEENADINRKRESYIKEEIKTLIKKLKSDNALKNQNEINVLVRIGAGHTGLPRDLQKEGIESTAVFSHLPFVFSFPDEAHRGANLGKPSKDEVFAKYLLSELLLEKFWRYADSTRICVAATRRLLSGLTMDDIRDISSALGRGEDIISAVEARGVKVPKSKEEFETMFPGRT